MNWINNLKRRFAPKSKVEILKEARGLIASGKWQFICFAIRDCDNYEFLRASCSKNCKELREWIQAMLGGRRWETLGNWIAQNHYEIYEQMTPEDLQEARLQWIDWMINELDTNQGEINVTSN